MQKLSDITGYPHIELDALSWLPNWQSKSDDRLLVDLEDALKQETWILDGNYSNTIPVKWKNVEVVIWLDYTFSLTIYRVTKRVFKRILSREELWPGTGNRESIRRSFFSRESIILWAGSSYHRKKRKLEGFTKDEKFKHIQFIRLKSPSEADLFLTNLLVEFSDPS